jgi:hypothetical protein
MRMVDARLRSLEERIALEQTTMRNELSRKITELEEASKKEFAAHAERLSTERAKRADDLKALSVELKESLKNLERRHVKFEEATSLADSEVRDQLMKHSARFRRNCRAPQRGSRQSSTAPHRHCAPTRSTPQLSSPR